VSAINRANTYDVCRKAIAMKSSVDAVESSSPRKAALIVGSDEAVAPIVQKALPAWKVVRADKNSSALEMLREKPFDLVLTGDETSSKEDVELLRQIRVARPHTRMIILTKQSTPADVIAAIRERAFSYFSEPYSTDSLTQMLQLATTGPVWDEGIEVLAATETWIRLLARCDLRTADRLLQFIHEISDLPEQERTAVGTAFRELLMNAIEHGAHFDPSQHVEIAYIRTKYAVACRVKDPGQGFSLDELRHAAITNPPADALLHLEERNKQGLRPGGFGILLAKHVVDEVIYGESGNDVILIKYLDRRGSSPEPPDPQAKKIQ
jgi:anti-sigma regulatory factor (Ser/Thr protein kinase)/ActR/RegA family two-component response regulator